MYYQKLKKIGVVFLFFVVIGVMHSCKYTLESESYAWQPYSEKDELIFHSNFGATQTVRIVSVEMQISDVDPLALLPKKHEVVKVFGECAAVINTQQLRFEKFELLKLSAFSKNRENIWFNWSTLLGKLYGNNVVELSDLVQKETVKLTTPLGELDTYIFEINDEFFGSRKDFIKKFYWNKDLGYVRYELSTGEVWTLMSKTSN